MSDLFAKALEQAQSGNLLIGGLIDAAGALTASGQPALARQLYQAWIAKNPDHPQLFVALFNCSGLDGQAGDPAAALESLKKSIALNADFIPAYINLGGFLERSGAPDRAIEL